MKASQIIRLIDEEKKNIEFMATGFKKLDDHLDGGFLKKELIIIGGMTGIGKSYFSAQIMYHIASHGFKSAYFSLEISNQMVVSRLLGSLSNIKSTRIIKGLIEKDELLRRSEAEASLKICEDFMDFYDDIYDFNQLVSEIKKNKYELIVIDFIQNVMLKNMDEYTRLTYIAIQLQKIAKENNCCIVILSQLSNFVAREKNKEFPEYKGSGAIAMVCDLGFYITRDMEQPRLFDIKLFLAKNRRGVSGVYWEFDFQGEGGMLNER